MYSDALPKVPDHLVARRCRALVRENVGDLEGARPLVTAVSLHTTPYALAPLRVEIEYTANGIQNHG